MDNNYPIENQFNDLSIRDIYYQNQSYLTKSENLTRKTYNNSNNRYDRNRSVLYDVRPPPPSPFNRNGDCFTFSNYDQTSYTQELGYDNVYSQGNPFINDNDERKGNIENNRPRALSFSETPEIVPIKKPSGKSKSIRDRNRRRQSYNPRAYESSSSDSDCTSLGSVDLDWRRRKRLGRLSTSNSSIRSELIGRCRLNPHYLKPDYNGCKALGRSPPPSNSILSGLSPTTVSRCQRQNDESTSSDSSL